MLLFIMLLLMFEYEQMDAPNVINKGPAKAESREEDSIRYGREWFFSFQKKMDGFRDQWNGPATFGLILAVSVFFFILFSPFSAVLPWSFSFVPGQQKGHTETLGAEIPLGYKNSSEAIH